jgi:hypothetical protein
MSALTRGCCAELGVVADRTKPAMRSPAACSACGTSGNPVERRTLVHMLVPDRFEHLGEREYRFCDSAECDTVYYSTDGEVVFRAADLRQRVGLKSSTDAAAPVCYCFGFTVGDLETDVCASSATIPGRVRELVKARMCACEVRNPSGRCCLAEIARIVKRLEAAPHPDPRKAIGQGGCDRLLEEEL